MILAILFIFGLIFGSFLNVVSLRYDEDKFILNLKVIGGRSHCPKCKKTLKWFELVPLLSFLIQKRKCRNCKCKISWQYPIVELVCGIILMMVPWFIRKNAFLFFSHPQIIPGYIFFGGILENIFVIFWILLFFSLVLLSLIDFKKLIIPDEINVFIAFLGIGISTISFYIGQFGNFAGSFLGSYASMFGFRENIVLNRLIAVLFAFVFLGIIIFFSRGKAMGVGDLKFAVALALVFGWPDIALILMLSFIIGSFFGLYLIFTKSKKLKDPIPFGPYIAMATMAVFFFGPHLMNLYFNLF